MNRLFHGCAYVTSDGIRQLLAYGENCIVRTNKCFRNDPDDVVKRTKTRSMTKKEGKVSLKTINDYFKNKEKESDMM